MFVFFSSGMSSAIRFIGNYDVNAEGKFLWEILCQLRKLGVGRIVTKNEWARKWPTQPSYIKIVRNLMTKKACEKAGVPFREEMKRAPLKLCIDPEFDMLTPFIKQAEPAKKGTSIYEEVDPKVFLDLYGKELPVKVRIFPELENSSISGFCIAVFFQVEAWNVGPATFTPRFSATDDVKVTQQLSS
ncbi:hypothetical protein ANCCEY_02944 [Ancylostoma ceylanicum]|uniref:Uncharacterized protein n=1 Tax=Ancylostoma ceylanicum TaxID=53326 RepID=A0A0D6M396_9BILA|nr:hypothetical protein ANCCEY_02944 [Ancylostoma ceylanicum]